VSQRCSSQFRSRRCFRGAGQRVPDAGPEAAAAAPRPGQPGLVARLQRAQAAGAGVLQGADRDGLHAPVQGPPRRETLRGADPAALPAARRTRKARERKGT